MLSRRLSGPPFLERIAALRHHPQSSEIRAANAKRSLRSRALLLIYAALSVRDSFRNLFADQPSRPFHERKFVRQAALEKHADARMPKHI